MSVSFPEPLLHSQCQLCARLSLGKERPVELPRNGTCCVRSQGGFHTEAGRSRAGQADGLVSHTELLVQ